MRFENFSVSPTEQALLIYVGKYEMEENSSAKRLIDRGWWQRITN
jgi:hypothetical protein